MHGREVAGGRQQARGQKGGLWTILGGQGCALNKEGGMERERRGAFEGDSGEVTDGPIRN